MSLDGECTVRLGLGGGNGNGNGNGNTLSKVCLKVWKVFGRDEGGRERVKCKCVRMYGCRLIYVCNMLCFPFVPQVVTFSPTKYQSHMPAKLPN